MGLKLVVSDEPNPVTIHPKCVHMRDGHVCAYIAAKTGIVKEIPAPFCNVTCKMFGPFDGKPLEFKQEQAWIDRVMQYEFNHFGNPKFISKIVEKFRKPVEITLPRNLEKLRRIYEPVARHPSCKQVCITGSALVKSAKWPPKDIDMNIVVADVDHVRELRSLLPEYVDGLFVDYWFKSYPSGFFVSLDIYNMKLYRSMNVQFASVPAGVEVVNTEGNFGLYDGLLQTAFRLAHEQNEAEKPVDVEAGLLPGNVVEFMLRSMGYKGHKSCQCQAMQQWMNEQGWWKCWKQRDFIVQWFTTKAREQNIEVNRETIIGLFLAGWKDIRKKKRKPLPAGMKPA